MTSDDLVKVIGAVAASLAIVLGAVGTLWAKVHEYRAEVNGKMQQLIELTAVSSRAEGRLEGEQPPRESEPRPSGHT